MSSHSKVPAFLGLPLEIRRIIYIHLFRSVRIHRKAGGAEHLAILRACRQLYHEAAPFVLPNVLVFCDGNAEVIDTLIRMSPRQITQLRNMLVHHSPVGFNLSRAYSNSETQPNATGTELQEGHGWNESNFSSDLEYEDVQYFHLGTVLGLFPGLQLDLLEVFTGIGGGPYSGHQTTDCFGSLLQADGYRQLWMEAAEGDGDAWLDLPSSRKWEETITTKFKPHNGWTVRIRLPGYEWEYYQNSTRPDDLWSRALDAGFTLVENTNDTDDNDTQNEDGHESEHTADIVVNRGDADICVKPGDNEVLECIDPDPDMHDDPPVFFKTVSDALRKLFRETSWEAIQAMEGFDDGSLDRWNAGDAVYAQRL
ncbi:hypothetical protein AJ78_08976 [Emergomyces pasteurianus Ep9510]|uniref:F-box domain-containing protein n=1 Tax=Emergomyces pasteurianus Ep9510 TaxID=1447872 RepID=A0A1J9Q164_9EURO|nr:hypothetical protein AJ78_08976 [Emergomyces pasteurianus Ep9510]